MSTSTTETPLLPVSRRAYTTIIHQNSNNAKRRGLCGWMRPKVGHLPEFRDSFSKQVFADPEGESLPIMHSAAVIRSWRSKYAPHIGKKHAAKLAKRKAA